MPCDTRSRPHKFTDRRLPADPIGLPLSVYHRLLYLLRHVLISNCLPCPHASLSQVLVVRQDLGMSSGKIAAQYVGLCPTFARLY